jgi:ABC-2 type transport system ATP-binding protein
MSFFIVFHIFVINYFNRQSVAVRTNDLLRVIYPFGLRYNVNMTENTEAIIETKDLKKTFAAKGKAKKRGPVEAVRGINFAVNKGEIFGLLGPNGAGKTTTMRMLCTLLTPTDGTVTIAGYDLKTNQAEIRTQIGYVSQVGGMQRESTGRENLMLQARLYGMGKREAIERVEEVLGLLGIEGFADRKTTTYSGGQRRLFDLASGIVHRPKILFLDEPSTGLDPQNRAHVWDQVKKLYDQGTTVFLTTHYLDEADALCNRVAIVDNGNIVALGTPDELKRQISGDILSLGFENKETADKASQIIGNPEFVRETQRQDENLILYVDKGDENLPMIMQSLNKQNVVTKKISLSRPTLDDVFLKLTGRSLRETDNQ